MLLALIFSKRIFIKFTRTNAEFQDTLNPLCTCGCDVENTCHFLLHCPNFLTERNTLLNKITNIDSNILNQADATATKTRLKSLTIRIS